MKTIYVATRYVQEDFEESVAVFSNRKSANQFAMDSFYPNRGVVREYHRSAIPSRYRPRFSKNSVKDPTRTSYYCFRNNNKDIPEHWRSDLHITRYTKDEVWNEGWRSEVYELKEKVLIPFFVFNYDISHQTVFVIREKTRGAFNFLCLSESFSLILKGSGAQDRRPLIHLIEKMTEYRYLSDNNNALLLKNTEELLHDFWKRFAINNSPMPDCWKYLWL